MENISFQQFPNINALFDGSYINSRALYMLHNHALPQVAYINHLDGEKAYNAFKNKYGEMIEHVYVYNWVRKKGGKLVYDRNLVLTKNGCVLEFDEDYIEISYPETVDGFVQELVKFSVAFKQRQRREPLEVNMIVHGSRGYELKAMEIKRTRLDIDLYYEDDFKPVDAIIRERLRRKKDKGIVLLHGLPGTGKTSYLRYLVGQIKKRVLFLSPSVAGHLSDPGFIDLIINHPDSVIIVEDADNIIMDRKINNSSSVSNLLNISDGLLADFLNVQLICTFNSSLTSIDQALLRKGRLIARYEFGKLSVSKAQRLSTHLGFEQLIQQPMTLADIANPHEMNQVAERAEILGFRRAISQN